MQHVVIVCGYGCHLVPVLQEHLDRIVLFINEEKPDCLIFCGGFAQRKSAPGVSEAGMMYCYITPRLRHSLLLVFLETDSYTSLDNIQLANKINRRWELAQPETKLTVFCEATRALKHDRMIRKIFRRRANLETASWELMDPLKQLGSTIYEWTAMEFPPLASYFRDKRIRRAEEI